MSGMQAVAQKHGVPLAVDSIGGMFGIYFAQEVPTSFAAVTQSNIEQFKQFFHAMLNEGVYLAPSAYEAGFTSIAHDNAIIDKVLVATEQAMQTLK